MIHVEGVAAKSLPNAALRRMGALCTNVTFHLGKGCHAISGGGTDPDVARLLLEVLAGQIKPSRGKVAVLGHAAGTAKATQAIAYVDRDVALPEDMTPLAIAALEGQLRGGAREPLARLRTLGLERFAQRPVRTLTPEERRSVALAIAVTSSAKVLLLDEPFVRITGEAAGRVAEAVRAFAAGGAERCVLVATASQRDAKALGAEVHGLVNERLVPATYGAGTEHFVLVVVVSDPMRLAAAVATEGGALTVTATATAVEIHTNDLVAAAEMVARAALAESLAVVSMTSSGAGAYVRDGRMAEKTMGEAARKLTSLAPPPPEPSDPSAHDREPVATAQDPGGHP